MEVFRGKSAAHAKKNATAQLEFLLAQHKDSPILFMVSGGSSLVLLEGLQISGNMTLTVLDERYSKDPAASNFNKLQRYEFFQNASHTLDVRVQENEPLEQFASRFEELLRNWKEQNPSGVVVATQGVAADGHTAG
ncbi:MAG: 6-phosphogluconolactonase, partial [Candidatus Wildermuthbacteria bacterium]|nr:6-phosphogluconolactonase [Candidatus Wildermuthbacteria bacterium]